MTKCHCGKSLHYDHPELEKVVKEMCDEFGEYTQMNIKGRNWKVQRHYVALHGIHASQIERLGFEEILTT